jgi:hypothetical protein
MAHRELEHKFSKAFASMPCMGIPDAAGSPEVGEKEKRVFQF